MMKGLTIAALVCSLGAAAASVYATVETHPNYVSTKKDLDDMDHQEFHSQKQYEILMLSEDDYHHTLSTEVLGAWGGAAAALVLAGVAMKKGGSKGLTIPTMIIALGAAGAAIAVMPQPL
jgi:hypothetical protein